MKEILRAIYRIFYKKCESCDGLATDVKFRECCDCGDDEVMACGDCGKDTRCKECNDAMWRSLGRK